ncbi:photosynthetic NDH subunit of subcomplex B 5, chloroplastic [Punica granatum]|uniref:Photosynthetic NDH subunit of subcomplex B 5, chloroplastic n=1 Tax=Punica granatum TaxID=22663 RepID=A0A6P8CLH9_PUNGR|nr:photosynthetic NDH subunit of subcomplex B 5, chloroplastic [Punica granatum]
MAVSVLSASSVPKLCSNAKPVDIRSGILNSSTRTRVFFFQPHEEVLSCRSRRRDSTRLNMGLSEIEPDLNEDPRDRWATNSVHPDDFDYGKYDGHHTYYEGEEEKGTFWGAIADDIKAVEAPTGFQGIISWLFLPAVAVAMYFNAPTEYLYIGAALFTVVFCIIEMDKPDKPHNFEPQIYNMEPGARDKLIADYNTMDIWDFNEKYGDLWDFTVKKDDITKR